MYAIWVLECPKRMVPCPGSSEGNFRGPCSLVWVHVAMILDGGEPSWP